MEDYNYCHLPNIIENVYDRVLMQTTNSTQSNIGNQFYNNQHFQMKLSTNEYQNIEYGNIKKSESDPCMSQILLSQADQDNTRFNHMKWMPTAAMVDLDETTNVVSVIQITSDEESVNLSSDELLNEFQDKTRDSGTLKTVEQSPTLSHNYLQVNTGNNALRECKIEKSERDLIVVKRMRAPTEPLASSTTQMDWLSREIDGSVIYECKICGRQCKWRSSISVHVRTHTGRKPYQCRICNHGFADSSTRKKHEKKTHNCVIPNVKKTKKTKSNIKSTTKQSKSQAHSQKEAVPLSQSNPYCPLCCQMFQNNEDLANHRAYCHQRFIHSCSICGQQFICETEFKQHEITCQHIASLYQPPAHSKFDEWSVCDYYNFAIPLPKTSKIICNPDIQIQHKELYTNENISVKNDDPLYLKTDPMLQYPILDLRIDKKRHENAVQSSNNIVTDNKDSTNVYKINEENTIFKKFENGTTRMVCQFCGKNFHNLHEFNDHENRITCYAV